MGDDRASARRRLLAADTLWAALVGLLAFGAYLATIYPGLVDIGDAAKFSFIGKVLDAEADRRPGERRCPRCRRRMRGVTVGAGPAIELDRCPVGHGLWLDAGELAAVVRSFGGGDGDGVAKFLGELFRHELTA